MNDAWRGSPYTFAYDGLGRLRTRADAGVVVKLHL
jgi:YD repeat-containing protein